MSLFYLCAFQMNPVCVVILFCDKSQVQNIDKICADVFVLKKFNLLNKDIMRMTVMDVISV